MHNLKKLTKIFLKKRNYQAFLKLENIDNDIKNSVDYIIPESFMNRPVATKASKLIKLSNNSKIEVIRN